MVLNQYTNANCKGLATVTPVSSLFGTCSSNVLPQCTTGPKPPQPQFNAFVQEYHDASNHSCNSQPYEFAYYSVDSCVSVDGTNSQMATCDPNGGAGKHD